MDNLTVFCEECSVLVGAGFRESSTSVAQKDMVSLPVKISDCKPIHIHYRQPFPFPLYGMLEKVEAQCHG